MIIIRICNKRWKTSSHKMR